MLGPGTTLYCCVGRRPNNQGWPVLSGSAGSYPVAGVWSGEWQCGMESGECGMESGECGMESGEWGESSVQLLV